MDGALLVLQRGLVEDDASVVTAGIRTIQSEIRLSPPVGTLGALEGIRADGCYHQHGPQIQFGGYGLGFLNNIANLTELWKDTGWTLNEEQWGILRHLIFDGYSLDLFFTELRTALSGEAVEQRETDYSVFVREQQAFLSGEGGKAFDDYFANT